jgi:hypothetical protein
MLLKETASRYGEARSGQSVWDGEAGSGLSVRRGQGGSGPSAWSGAVSCGPGWLGTSIRSLSGVLESYSIRPECLVELCKLSW